MKIDKKVIKELSDYLDEFNLTEIEITEKDTKMWLIIQFILENLTKNT